MDIVRAARAFDKQVFDEYNFATSSWELETFTAQYKLADVFLSIYNRPGRKRMLYCAPDQIPTKSVVRVPSTAEIFLVGNVQLDSYANTMYRAVIGLHHAAVGPASVSRMTPSVSAGIKGWATSTLVRNTFADAEMRSVNERQDEELTNYGHYFLFLPSDENLQRHDTVTIGSKVFYVLETYVDSGIIYARATIRPEERVNFVYTSVTGESHDVATQTTTETTVTYNTTGKVVPLAAEDIPNTEVLSQWIRLMVLDSFISYTPAVNDRVSYGGLRYTVQKVERDSILDEWYLTARVGA